MRTQILISALFLLVFQHAATTEARETQHPGSSLPIAFLHVNVIPMDRDHVVEDQTVVTQGGRILQIDDFKRVTVPLEAQRIEAKGKSDSGTC